MLFFHVFSVIRYALYPPNKNNIVFDFKQSYTPPDKNNIVFNFSANQGSPSSSIGVRINWTQKSSYGEKSGLQINWVQHSTNRRSNALQLNWKQKSSMRSNMALRINWKQYIQLHYGIQSSNTSLFDVTITQKVINLIESTLHIQQKDRLQAGIQGVNSSVVYFESGLQSFFDIEQYNKLESTVHSKNTCLFSASLGGLNACEKELESTLHGVNELQQFTHLEVGIQSLNTCLHSASLGGFNDCQKEHQSGLHSFNELQQYKHLEAGIQSFKTCLFAVSIEGFNDCHKQHESTLHGVNELQQFKYLEAGIQSFNTMFLESEIHGVNSLNKVIDSTLHGVNSCTKYLQKGIHSSNELQQKSIFIKTLHSSNTSEPDIVPSAQIIDKEYYIQVNAKKYDISDVSINDDRGTYGYSGSVTLHDNAAFLALSYDSEFTLVLGDESYLMLVEEKSMSRQSPTSTEYTIHCICPTAKLAEPRAKKRAVMLENGLMASELVQLMADEAGVSVKWDAVDWFIFPQRVQYTDVTPMEVIQKITGAIRANIVTLGDGSLWIRPHFSVQRKNWNIAAPAVDITDDDDVLSYSEGYGKTDYINQVRVTDAESDQWSFTFEGNDDSGGKLFLYRIPWAQNVEVLHSGRQWVKISYKGVTVREITQQVEFKDGAASVSDPIFDIVKIKWFYTPPEGEVKFSGKNMVTHDDHYSLAEITYTARRHEFGVYNNKDGDKTQFLARLKI